MFFFEINFVWFIFNYFVQIQLLLALITRVETIHFRFLLIFIEIFNPKDFFLEQKNQPLHQQQPSKSEHFLVSNKKRFYIERTWWIV